MHTGGICIDAAAQVFLHAGSRVSHNTAQRGGGGISVRGTLHAFLGSEISHNYEGGDLGGGGILLIDEGIAFIAGKVIGNVAESNGAGIYMAAGALTLVPGSALSGNFLFNHAWHFGGNGKGGGATACLLAG